MHRLADELTVVGSVHVPSNDHEYREEPYAVPCPVCSGFGWTTPGRLGDCPECEGTGRVTATRWTVTTAPGSVGSTSAPPPQVSPDGRFYWDGTAWRPYPTGPTGGPMVVAAMGQLGPRKRAAWYVFASFLVTGLGTMLAGRFWRGLWLVLLDVAGTVGVVLLLADAYGQTVPDKSVMAQALVGGNARVCSVAGCSTGTELLVALGLTVLLTGLWIYGMVDAVRTVHRWNRAHGYTH